MSFDNNQTRFQDEGGGGRYEALANHTDMDDIEYGNKRKNSETENEPSKTRKEERESEQNNEVRSPPDLVSHLLIVELVGDSVVRKLIEDRAGLRYLLMNSEIWEKSTGIPRFQVTKQRIIFHIIDANDITELLKIKKLSVDGESWPIECHRAQNNPGLSCLGVLKGIRPSVTPERVKLNLGREGTEVIKCSRITRRFNGNIIDKIV